MRNFGEHESINNISLSGRKGGETKRITIKEQKFLG
jgi:hypothetical protein